MRNDIIVKISIIMPVFNDEKYLSTSLTSIFQQTLTDLEVICINDGSTDNSLEILEDFKSKFNKITIINQQNLGSGVARNNGMSIAKGEYIAFLDADDIFVDDNALEEMYNIAKSSDANMVSANLKGITVKGEIVNNEVLTRFTQEKIIRPEEYEIPFSYYKNIFKRDFLIKNNITFPDLKRGQDPVFLAEILTKIKELPVTPVNLYGFRYSPIGGLNKIDTPEKKFDYIKHFKETFDLLRNAKFDKMFNRYIKKLDEYINFSNNKHDKYIYNSVQEIFKNDEKILSHLNTFFSIDKTKISIILQRDADEKSLLSKTLESILNQTLKDLEVIYIDNNQKESTLELLNEFEFVSVLSEKYENINQAHNLAIETANGDYISFIKVGDIYLENTALEKLYNRAIENNANVVSGNIKLINNKNEICQFKDMEYYKEASLIPPNDYEIPHSIHKSLFKSYFLLKNEINFPNLLCEGDSFFTAKMLSQVDGIFTIPNNIYAEHQHAKFDSYEKIHDYVLQFKQVFNCLNETKYEKINQKFRYQLINSVEKFDDNTINSFLKAIHEIFDDDPCFLRGFEYYIYYLYKNNQNSNILKINFDENHPRVSVVIPVYNAEEFLDDSIGSLLNQTLRDIELVCVNDGSKDNSLSILQEFASKDNRVKIIDQENGGCGAARNKSLDNAIGDYIYFFDPDDHLVEDGLEKLYLNAFMNDSDLVLFKLAFWTEGKPIDYSQPHFDLDNYFKNVDFNQFTFNHDDVKKYVMNARAFAPWFKLYKHDFLTKYDDFYFPVNLPFDDVPFHIMSLLRASKMSFIPEYFYHYRIDNPNSINSKPSNAMGIIQIIQIVENFLKNEGYFENFKKEFYNFKIFHTFIYLFRSADPEQYFQEVKKHYLKIKSEFLDEEDENKLSIEPYHMTIFNMVINSNSFIEYKLHYSLNDYKNKNNNLTKINNELLEENKKLTTDNEILTQQMQKSKQENLMLTQQMQKSKQENLMLTQQMQKSTNKLEENNEINQLLVDQNKMEYIELKLENTKNKTKLVELNHINKQLFNKNKELINENKLLKEKIQNNFKNKLFKFKR